LKVCLDNQVQYVLPLGKLELAPLAEAKVLFAEYGIQILVPDMAVLKDLLYFEEPNRAFDLRLLAQGVDLISHQILGPEHYSGLYVLSDSQEEFSLVLVAS